MINETIKVNIDVFNAADLKCIFAHSGKDTSNILREFSC
jgi:hypothetical protein